MCPFFYPNTYPISTGPNTYGSQQSLQHVFGCRAALQRPADHPPRIKIDDDGKIRKAFHRLDVCDVGDPKAIGRVHIKLTVKCVIDDQRRLAAVLAGTALVSDLRFDTSTFCQSCNAVRATSLPLITQIIMQLPIAIDITAINPCLADDLRLPMILLRSLAQGSLLPCIIAARMDMQTTSPEHNIANDALR